MKNILCLLGIHKYKYLGVSHYSYSSGLCQITEESQKVYQCERCGKLDAPWWWDKSERDLRPYEQIIGYDEWKRDVKLIPQSKLSKDKK